MSIAFPRLCLIAFNFCQPFLISRTLDWSIEDINDQTYSIGYGLIGAYLLVFVGIAVSFIMTFTAGRRTNILISRYRQVSINI